jgi:hypothetical protein
MYFMYIIHNYDLYFSDDLTQMVANFLIENPWVLKLGSITLGVLIIVTVVSKLRRLAEVPQQKKDK